MSEGFSSVACFSITTLLVVSLANLILLILMILESRKKCSSDVEFTDTAYRSGALIKAQNQANFMAALVLIKGSFVTLICGTVIVSKFWVLTAAHCCERVRVHPFENLKISSNSDNWKKGKKHSIENLVRHINFTSKSPSYDVCLIKIGSPFKEANEQIVAIASLNYRYVTDTTAATLGWSSKKSLSNSLIYNLQVNLISFQRCKTLIKAGKVDETMVCAYNIENNDCRFDSGGPLIQNNVVIGITSFETDCAKRPVARAFTRMSVFEKWFEMVEKQNGVKIGAVFKA